MAGIWLALSLTTGPSERRAFFVRPEQIIAMFERSGVGEAAVTQIMLGGGEQATVAESPSTIQALIAKAAE